MKKSEMRILHTSDWHLGRALYGQSLIDDQAFALDKLLEIIDRRKPHALLISGDLFDRALPPESAVVLFDRFLNEAAGRRSLQVFIIPGNHDSRERVGFASSLLRDQRVTIFSKLSDAFHPVLVKGDGAAKIWVHGFPFVEPAEIGRYLRDDNLKTPDQATRALCRAITAANTEVDPKILLCHAFVCGGEISESEREIYIGGSSQVDASAFDEFAYTALGHLHKPQKVARDCIRYSGSLLPYSKSEIGTPKSVTEVIFDEEYEISFATHALTPRRELRYLEGEIERLIQLGQEDPAKEDYILVGLTDSGAVLDAFAKLRTIYPNLLHVSRAGGYLPAEVPALNREREGLSDLELFREFFRETTGSDLSEGERSVLIEVLKEVTA